MVPNGDSYEVYEKTAYEANGGGLLFRILHLRTRITAI